MKNDNIAVLFFTIPKLLSMKNDKIAFLYSYCMSGESRERILGSSKFWSVHKFNYCTPSHVDTVNLLFLFPLRNFPGI